MGSSPGSRGVPAPDLFDSPESYRRQVASSLNLPLRFVIYAELGNIEVTFTEQKFRLLTILQLLPDQGNISIKDLQENFFKSSAAELELILLLRYGRTSADRTQLLRSWNINEARILELTAQYLNRFQYSWLFNSVQDPNAQDEYTWDIREVKLEMERLQNIYQQLRQFQQVQVHDRRDLGLNYIFHPVLPNGNVPTVQDLSMIMDNSVALREIPVLIAQIPGAEPIIKYYQQLPREHLQEFMDVASDVKEPIIYGNLLFGATVQKNRLMLFRYTLSNNTFKYRYTESTLDPLSFFQRAFPSLQFTATTTSSISTAVDSELAFEEDEDNETVGPLAIDEPPEINAIIQEPETTSYLYYFIFRNAYIDNLVLFELANRFTFFRTFVHMDEDSKAFPEMKNVYMYVSFPYMEQKVIRISLTQLETIDVSGQILPQLGARVSLPDNNLQYPLVHLLQCLLSWVDFGSRGGGILPWTQPAIVSIGQYYQVMLNTPVAPVAPLTKSGKSSEKMLLTMIGEAIPLSSQYPEIFPQGYEELVPEDRRPTVHLQQPHLPSIQIGKYWATCSYSSFNLVKLKQMRIGGKIYQLPICTRADWLPEAELTALAIPAHLLPRVLTPSPARSPLPPKKAGDLTPTIRPKDLAKKLRDLPEGAIGDIDPLVATILKQARPLDPGSYYVKRGTRFTPNSALLCILRAISHPDLFGLSPNRYYSFLNNFRLQLGAVYPSVCKQELYDLSEQEISERLTDSDFILDTALYYRALEEFFEINLMIWVAPNVGSGEQMELEIPRHRAFHLHRVREERPTIILVRHNLPEVQRASYSPHYEIVEHYHEAAGSGMVFGADMSGKLRELYETKLALRVFGVKALDNPFTHYHPTSLFQRGSEVPIAKGQILDSLGKQRCVLLEYRNGQQISVFGLPQAPENLPTLAFLDNLPNWSLLRRILPTPSACTRKNGLVVGVFYPLLGIPRALYIPIIPEVINLAAPDVASPYLQYHYDEAPELKNFLQRRQEQTRLLSILHWLYTLSGNLAELMALLQIQETRYQLKGLAISLPNFTTLIQGLEYLERETRGLIVAGKILVSRPQHVKKIQQFWQAIANAGNPQLREKPAYLSGYYQNYSDFRQDRGALVISRRQLRQKFSPFLAPQIFRLITTFLEEPLVLAFQGRYLLVVPIPFSTGEQERATALQLALKSFSEKGQSLMKVRNDGNILDYPYCRYEVNNNGLLVPVKDLSGGNIPYLEVGNGQQKQTLALLPL